MGEWDEYLSMDCRSRPDCSPALGLAYCLWADPLAQQAFHREDYLDRGGERGSPQSATRGIDLV